MAFRSVPRPSSPPGAKASTECPFHTPIQWSVVRRQWSDKTIAAATATPCTETIVRHGRRFSVASHQRDDGRQITDARSERSSDLNHLRHRTRMLLRSLRRTHIIRINSHNVSEHSPSDLGAFRHASRHAENSPGQTSTEQRPVSGSRWRRSEISDNRQLKTGD